MDFIIDSKSERVKPIVFSSQYKGDFITITYKTKEEIVSGVFRFINNVERTFKTLSLDFNYNWAVNYVKYKPKYKQIKNENGKTISHTLKYQGLWMAYLYKIPKEWPIDIVQYPRHFKIKTKGVKSPAI